nr:hypothetical protein [Streptomyces sp. SID5468]
MLVTAVAVSVSAATLLTARDLRRRVDVIRAELAAHRADTAVAQVPGARAVPRTEEIRTAVAEALADERERELAEARAFWAAQDAREAAESAGVFDPLSGLDPLGDLPELPEDDLPPYPPRPSEPSGPAGLVRRHPSDPDFTPSSAVADPQETAARLDALAEAATPLADVRPGPLGTLDLYVFADGTTLCLTPGHRETADRLADALAAEEPPVLVGGSGVLGAYTLTFACGDQRVYVLADRVVASS